VYVPVLNGLFHTVPLGTHDWVAIVGCGVLVLLIEEARKVTVRAVRPDVRS